MRNTILCIDHSTEPSIPLELLEAGDLVARQKKTW